MSASICSAVPKLECTASRRSSPSSPDTGRTRDSHRTAIGESAGHHGHDLLTKGFTVSQVVHDYGDVCQAITELAMEMHAPISTSDFHALNRCLDDAIAAAVTQFGREREESNPLDPATARGNERLGFLPMKCEIW
jgi:hypothetical protein